VRIISGKNKGRKITAPGNLPVRPTTDFAKEGLFNILANHFDFKELEVLDLFAGTGNISYEFISREAKSVLAIDINTSCTNFIKQTAEKLNYKNLFVIRSDYKSFLIHTEKKWDMIYADPPYDMEGVADLPVIIFNRKILKPDGWLIIEHSRNTDFSAQTYCFDHRKYGNVNFSLFREQ
jgi:16S rRNA (guanine(966)-N(2))-methyltransferase RsmD